MILTVIGLELNALAVTDLLQIRLTQLLHIGVEIGFVIQREFAESHLNGTAFDVLLEPVPECHPLAGLPPVTIDPSESEVP